MSAVSAAERRDAIDTFAVAMMIGLTLSWGLNGVAAKLSNTRLQPGLPDAGALGARRRARLCLVPVARHPAFRTRRHACGPACSPGCSSALEFLLIFVGPRLHLGRAQHAARQHDAVLDARRRSFSARRTHVGAKDRRASSRLRRPGADLLRQAQPAGPDALIGDLMSLGAGLPGPRPTSSSREPGLPRPVRKSCCSTSSPSRPSLPRSCCPSPARRSATPMRVADLGDALPGGLYRRHHLCAVVLAVAALSGLGPGQLHFPDAGLRRALCRPAPWRAARSALSSLRWC